MPHGYFQSGNPSTGQKATNVDRDWANHVQEEICTVIERAGLTPSKTDMTQLWQALRTMTRYKLVAPLDLYVSPTGNDSNPGTSSAPFATLQGAWGYIQGNIDPDGLYTVTVHIADGTYAPVLCANTVNGPPVQFVGNVASPGNVVINNPTGPAIAAVHNASISVSGVRVIAGGSGADYVSGGVGLDAASDGQISFHHVDFGSCTNAHISANFGGIISLPGAGAPFSISGPSNGFIVATNSGNAGIVDGVCTLVGTPAFATAFALASTCATILAEGCTFTGAATGPRYAATLNGVIHVDTASNPSFSFPGNAAGATGTGGQYA